LPFRGPPDPSGSDLPGRRLLGLTSAVNLNE
jgi:hypothetical protein